MIKIYYINAFIPITVEKDNFFFGISNNDKNSYNNNFIFEGKQKEVMLELIKGKGYDISELIELYNEKLIEYFIEKNIIVDYIQDQKGLESRTNAYFDMNLNKRALERLKNSKVLILGCGGIGTHVAWNLTTMGVGELILVDFDKVELSNLNRQLLFSTDDIGKLKIEVLKDKLIKINPSVKVKAVNKKITSEDDLQEIVAIYSSNLIIKSLDSPIEFPEWLDSVCNKYRINYIGGTTSGRFSLVGPTYIAGYSHKYTDFFEKINKYDVVSGLAPSISIQQYQCSSEISIEAVKLLTKMDIGVLKYVNKIHYIDVIHNIEMDMVPLDDQIETDIINKNSVNKNILLVSLIILLIMQATGIYQLLWGGVIFLVIAPTLIYKTPKYAAMASYSNLSWFLSIGMIIVIISNSLLDSSVEFYSIISSIMVLFVLYSLIVLAGTATTRLICCLKVKLLRGNLND